MGLRHMELMGLYIALNLRAGLQGSGIKKSPFQNWNGLFALCSLLYGLCC